MSISADHLIVVTFVIAAVLGAGRTFTLSGELGKWLGPAKWSFSESWASTFTLVGALLGTVLLQSGAVPEATVHLPVVAYAGLNLLFGVMTVLAPMFFTVFQTATPPKPTDPQEPLYRGFVWAFLLASSLTLWAVLGELAAILLLLDEIRRTQGLSKLAFCALLAPLGLSAPLLSVYWLRTTGWVVKYQALPPATKTGDPSLDLTEDRAVSARLRPWPLL